jgi:predicted RNase H-like HicB family nuclease
LGPLYQEESEISVSTPSRLVLHGLIEKEGNLYSALCLELDVASQGRSVEEAKRNLKEAVELYLETIYEKGDEREFIPRPAPVEEWLKFFKVQAQALSRESLKRKAPISLELDSVVLS